MSALKFTPELEQAILAKRKSETRRPMDPQPEHFEGGYFWPSHENWKIAWAAEDSSLGGVKNPADWKPGFIFDPESTIDACPYGAIGRWFPVGSTTHQITGIRAERIQDITEEAALAEGVDLLLCPQCGCSGNQGDTISTRCPSSGCGLDYLSAIERFKEIWQEIYPGSWERNEWVWVIQFAEVA